MPSLDGEHAAMLDCSALELTRTGTHALSQLPAILAASAGTIAILAALAGREG